MSQAELVYQHLKQLPDAIATQVLDFVQFLERKQQAGQARRPRQPGSARGQVWIADDFDAPLSDFRDYQ